ncbi:MAG: hypothetical protein GY705_22805 [Bacteroidetes bacterium]|nr:hypothetical protein [Bacteroidota bacterium]
MNIEKDELEYIKHKLVERECQLKEQLAKMITVDRRCERQVETIRKLENELWSHLQYSERLRNLLKDTYKSSSWRITLPLRIISTLMKSLLQKGGFQRGRHMKKKMFIPHVPQNPTSMPGTEQRKMEQDQLSSTFELEDVQKMKSEIKYWRVQALSLLEDLENIRKKTT